MIIEPEDPRLPKSNSAHDQIDLAWASFPFDEKFRPQAYQLQDAYIGSLKHQISMGQIKSYRPIRSEIEERIIQRLAADFRQYVEDQSRLIKDSYPHRPELHVAQVQIPKFGRQDLQLVIDHGKGITGYRLLAQLFNSEHQSLALYPSSVFPISAQSNSSGESPALMLKIERKSEQLDQLDLLTPVSSTNFELKLIYSKMAFEQELAYLKAKGESIYQDPVSRPYLSNVIQYAIQTKFPDLFHNTELIITKLRGIGDSSNSTFRINTNLGRFFVRLLHDAPQYDRISFTPSRFHYSYEAEWQCGRI